MPDYAAVREYWRSNEPKTPEELDILLGSFRVLFAYHSGKIENDQITYHDTREIFENGKALNFTGDPRVLFEQQNQKLCYDFLRRKTIEKEPLSVEPTQTKHLCLAPRPLVYPFLQPFVYQDGIEGACTYQRGRDHQRPAGRGSKGPDQRGAIRAHGRAPRVPCRALRAGLPDDIGERKAEDAQIEGRGI